MGYTVLDSNEHNYTRGDLDGNSGITTKAFDLAAQLGIIAAAAAGNEGSNDWERISTPANGDSVIAVGGVNDDFFNRERSAFSGWGPTADGPHQVGRSSNG